MPLLIYLKPVSRLGEWMNVLQHVSPDGDKHTPEAMRKIEGEIIRFLNYGEDVSIAEDIIIALNSRQDYAGGRENQWLKRFPEIP